MEKKRKRTPAQKAAMRKYSKECYANRTDEQKAAYNRLRYEKIMESPEYQKRKADKEKRAAYQKEYKAFHLAKNKSGIDRNVTKRCCTCKEEKPGTDFFICRANSGGLGKRCKACRTKEIRDYRNGPNRHKYLEIAKRAEIRATYGIELEEVERIKSGQKHACAICGANDLKLHIDHCHDTGKVRGLLCMSCNCGIGSLRNSPEIMGSAINYLRGNPLMSRKKSPVNTYYFPIGTLALAPDLVDKIRAQAELSGGVAAVVRACLTAILLPDSPENKPFVITAKPQPQSKEPEENPWVSVASDW